MKTLADNGCLIMWSGEGGVRFYAAGIGETRAARHLLRQAYLRSIPQLRLRVVRKMYEMRFGEALSEDLTLAADSWQRRRPRPHGVFAFERGDWCRMDGTLLQSNGLERLDAD